MASLELPCLYRHIGKAKIFLSFLMAEKWLLLILCNDWVHWVKCSSLFPCLSSPVL